MKWFKHQCNARDDEGLIQVRAEFGMAGYGRYFAILETVGGRSRNDCFELTLPEREWCSILDLRPTSLRLFLKKLAELGLNSYSTRNQLVTIGVPKLAKYRDEYSRKSGHAPDNVAPEPEPDTDTERDSSNRPSTRASRAREPEPAPVAGRGKPQSGKPKTEADRMLELVSVNLDASAAKIRDMLSQDGALELTVRTYGGWTKLAEELRTGGVGAQNRFRIAFGQACAAKSRASPRGSPQPVA